MKKVTAFDGSPRRRHTYDAVREFLDRLSERGGVETEIVRLSDYRIERCRGCQLCFDRGEELCPLKDDRDVLLQKIAESDGVVFASPNYSFQVSGLMKLFLDRCGFLFHRPRFHRKIFTSIVVQGIFGGEKIVSYLDFVGAGLGFDVVKGICCMTREPMTAIQKRRMSEAIAGKSRQFHEQLFAPADRAPTLRQLMVFRMSRTLIRRELDERSIDYRYYAENGWLESDYYYHPARLGMAKRQAGRLFDTLFARVYGQQSRPQS